MPDPLSYIISYVQQMLEGLAGDAQTLILGILGLLLLIMGVEFLLKIMNGAGKQAPPLETKTIHNQPALRDQAESIHANKNGRET